MLAQVIQRQKNMAVDIGNEIDRQDGKGWLCCMGCASQLVLGASRVRQPLLSYSLVPGIYFWWLKHWSCSYISCHDRND